MKSEEIAQYVIDNRFSKIPDVELYNNIIEMLNKLSESNNILSTGNWRIIEMPELYEYFDSKNNSQNKTWICPTYPTRRWGNTYTLTSTTNIKEINNILIYLKNDGFTVKKRIEKETNLGKFYQILIRNHQEKIIK